MGHIRYSLTPRKASAASLRVLSPVSPVGKTMRHDYDLAYPLEPTFTRRSDSTSRGDARTVRDDARRLLQAEEKLLLLQAQAKHAEAHLRLLRAEATPIALVRDAA